MKSRRWVTLVALAGLMMAACSYDLSKVKRPAGDGSATDAPRDDARIDAKTEAGGGDLLLDKALSDAPDKGGAEGGGPDAVVDTLKPDFPVGPVYQSWSELKLPKAGVTVSALSAHKDALLLGTTDGAIYHSGDKGGTWGTPTSGLGNVLSLAMDGSNAVAMGTGGKLMVSTSGGKGWTTIPACGSGTTGGADVLGQVIAAASSSGTVCWSDDLGGKLNSKAVTMSSVPVKFRGVSLARVGTKTVALAVGYYNPRSSKATSFVYLREGAKAAWKDVTGDLPATDYMLFAARLSSSGRGYIAASDKTVLTAPGLNKQWVKVQLSKAKFSFVQALAYDPPGILLAGSTQGTSGAFLSVNEGNTYQHIAGLKTIVVYAAAFSGTGLAYVGGHFGSAKLFSAQVK